MHNRNNSLIKILRIYFKSKIKYDKLHVITIPRINQKVILEENWKTESSDFCF